MGNRPGCEPGCGCAGNEFGERAARNELRAYRRHGPERTTAWLIEGLAAGGVDGLTVLDIGAGVGAVHHELLALGAAAATDVDGSPAYVAAAQEEARRRGTADLIRHEVGDFVALAADLEPADLVALDRVVCCYPDMAALVRLSVAHARRRYGLVYPRDSWWIRIGTPILNASMRLARQKVRAYIHPTASVDALVRAGGFAPRLRKTSLFWQVVVYERLAG